MIEIVNAGIEDVMRNASGRRFRLIVADPPWIYEREAGVANPDNHYPTLSEEQITEHIDAAYDLAEPGARLVLWACWPLLPRAMSVTGSRWEYKTGGSWHKEGTAGVGFHWRGQSEPVLIFSKPGAQVMHRDANLSNAGQERNAGHSMKPVGWTRAMLRRWTNPGDAVLDLYAGLGSVARACHAEGRAYLGAEIDPQRHREASAFLDDAIRQRTMFG